MWWAWCEGWAMGRGERDDALEHLDFAIREFQEMRCSRRVNERGGR